jgi:glyoxylase-like metal-dependent hydrolase (beta-lactamase superfamily II)
MFRRAVCFVVFGALLSGAAQTQTRVPHKTRIADGIFLFTTAPYGDVGLDGNSIVILSSDGALVFDTNGTPAAAAEVLSEIRRMTDQPVRYVVNSHWHWDHWYGTEIYQREFPDLKVVSHEKTRELMRGPALEFNRPGLERDLPAYLKNLETRAAASSDPSLQALLSEDKFFLEQKRSVHHGFPNTTFINQLTVYLGDREIQILNYGRAVTPGDTFLYLPKEKILITGDLLVNPISFALSCYPTEWLRTLERLDKLDTSVIIPGHGGPLRDKELLHATMDVFRELLRQGKDAKGKGLDADAAKKIILAELAALKSKITFDSPSLSNAFDVQLVDWYLHRVYDELDGPLSDAIAPIPRQ